MSTPQERLFDGYYNSAGFTDANPGGLGNSGHVQNFPAALQDIGVVAQDVGVKSGAAAAAAGAAQGSAAAAAEDRLLAQQAAASAAEHDASGRVLKTGDSMSGPLKVVGGDGGYVELAPGPGPTGGFINFSDVGGGYKARIYTAAGHQYFEAETDRQWRFTTPVQIQGVFPWSPANDGSGSGLDADYFRGREPAFGAIANTIAQRSADGSIAFATIYCAVGGGLYFNELSAALTVRDADAIQFPKGLYLGGALSASTVTERSDRRLKKKIEDMRAADRLRPRRFVMKADGAERAGFIAQEVMLICPEAVAVGTDGVLEVRAMALIAHLSAQLNAALDRIAALEGR